MSSSPLLSRLSLTFLATKFFLYLFFGGLIVTTALQDAVAKPLKQIERGEVFLGGQAPRLLSLDVVQKFEKGGKAYYKLKATVKRAGGDRNGFMTVLQAPTWRAAILKMANADPVLNRELQIFFPKLAGSDQKFPPLRLKYRYNLTIYGQGRNPGKSRRAKGPDKFVEPIALGVSPGTIAVGLQSCVELAKHPIADVMTIASVMAVLVDLKGFLTPFGLAKAAFVKAIKRQASCTNVLYQYNLKAKVPALIGLAPSEAKKKLEADNLGVKFVKTTCNAAKAKVTKQNPAAGSYLAAGREVTVTYCVRDNSGGSGGSTGPGTYVVYYQQDKIAFREADGTTIYRFQYATESTLPSDALRLRSGFKTYDEMTKWVCDRPVYFHYWARNWAFMGSHRIGTLPCGIKS